MHPRRVIRESVADAIRAANTAAADRVWASFEPPVSVKNILINEGPVVLVYTRRDRAKEEDYAATGSGYVKRTCDLCIEILAAGPSMVDDKLDDLADVIEVLIDGFSVPGMPAAEIRLMETNIETAEQFEQPVGGAFLMYDACYWKQWRPDEEDVFFPTQVKASIRGDAGEIVADCTECDQCPEGAHP